MSNEKRSDSWIGIFALIGIMVLVASMYVAFTIHMEITTVNIILALLPSITFWSWFCLDLWQHNGRPRYMYRWLDSETGEERRFLGSSFHEIYEQTRKSIMIRQKVSGIGGYSTLIIPEPPACNFPNAAGWSLDRSSTLKEIVLVDTYGVAIRTTSLETAIWTVTSDWSVATLLGRAKQDAVRLEQYGKQRDELIGAFLCLERLVDKERDTFGNSPYGQLVRHYTNKVLHRLLEQDVDLTRSVFLQKMDSWQHLADQCTTRFGRR